MATSSDSLRMLAGLISKGLSVVDGDVRAGMDALFGERYQRRFLQPTTMRYAYALASTGDEGVPYAGYINPDNPPNGPYGGTSVVWFPTGSSFTTRLLP